MRQLRENLIKQDAISVKDEAFQPFDTTISHFCQFVDYYTKCSTDPMTTAAVCEHRAEEIRLTPREVTQENVSLLIITMLTAINHLEHKWFEEQMYREEFERKRWNNRVKQVCRTWIRRVWKRCRRNVPLPIMEHTT